ncbi:MAG TPA: tetratricopeptide repeat protein, partial [Fulvivirga sp.]|nr:tetratricopeptide repeat protein [Fulvivirga sp.]
MEVDTVTGVNAGDTMRWELARDINIIKINNINVNEDKNGRKSTDIWKVKPKSTDGGQTMEGMLTLHWTKNQSIMDIPLCTKLLTGIKRRIQELHSQFHHQEKEEYNILKNRKNTISMILFCIMLILFTDTGAQNQRKADSLISVLETEDLNNKEIITALYQISANSTQPDRSIFYANELLDVALKHGTYEDVLLGYIQMGGGYRQKGNLSKALEAFLKAAEISAENKDLISEGDAYTNIGFLYSSFEDYDKALGYYNKVLKLYKNKVDSVRLAGLYINYGYATYKANLYDSSIALSKKAIYYAQFSPLDYVAAYAKANMALALAKVGQLENSENELNEAMLILEKNKNHYGLSDCLIEIGGVYLEEGNTKTAIEKLSLGYKIAVENGLKEQIQNGAKFLSEAYQQLGDLPKALDYQTKYYTYRDSLINADQIRKLADLRTNYEVGQKQVEVDLLTSEKRIQQIIIFSTAGGALLVAILLGLVYKNYRDKNKINAILEEQKAQLEKLNTTKDKFFSI